MAKEKKKRGLFAVLFDRTPKKKNNKKISKSNKKKKMNSTKNKNKGTKLNPKFSKKQNSKSSKHKSKKDSINVNISQKENENNLDILANSEIKEIEQIASIEKNNTQNEHQSSNKRPRKKYGFAKTKEDPHKNHPSFYRRKDSDNIDYVTFTHSQEVTDPYDESKTINTIPLTSNIDSKERGKRKSFIFPYSYSGKRSALGKEEKDYSLTNEDWRKVINCLDTLPKKKITYTSNSKKKK